MSFLCTYARFQSLSPLADRRVNDVLLQTFPGISKALLQLIDAVQTTFVHSLLHDSPYLIVDRVKVWAVGRLEVRFDEVGCFQLCCCIEHNLWIFTFRVFQCQIVTQNRCGEENETIVRWPIVWVINVPKIIAIRHFLFKLSSKM